MKIKYQSGLTKFITTKLGNVNKRRFINHIQHKALVGHDKKDYQILPLEVVSFSSRRDVFEQILSILSFLQYVGEPKIWTIYSDGSHLKKHSGLLTSLFGFVNIRVHDWNGSDDIVRLCKTALVPYKEHLLDYAKLFPLGKKLYYYLNHNIKIPTLFVDSDILFYKKAPDIERMMLERVNGWYLPDEGWGALDSRYLNKYAEQLYQVNTGFLLFNQELANLEQGLEFLKSLDSEYEYFSEQTIMHIILKDNGFLPADPRTFVLNSEDQFDFSYLIPRERMAIRHYTGPVRHKMWQKDWKWHLSAS